MLQTTRNALRALAARVEALERLQGLSAPGRNAPACEDAQAALARPMAGPAAPELQTAERCAGQTPAARMQPDAPQRRTALEAQWDNLYAYNGTRQKGALA